MNKFLGASLMVLLLAGCSTTQEKAAVEDRSAAGDAVATSGATDSAAADGSASSSGLGDSQVSGTPMDDGSAAGGDPRKVPGALLGERSVYFDFDKYDVKDSYTPMLEAHAGYMKSHDGARIVIQGNTDDRGSREYNLALGQKRAEAVRKSLGVLGVDDTRMEAVSFGEEKPKAEGQNEEAWAQNRRADIVYGDE